MTLITTNQVLREFCATLQNAPFITVDTEFLREKTYYAKLCLIQLSGPDKQAAAVDVLSSDEEIDCQPIWDLMNNPKILKVFHAARQDLEIIYQLSHHIPAPLYDTQIAAMVCGYGDQIGYDSLVSDICHVHVDKTSQFTDWSHRPLSAKQINYALDDVIHLVDIYQKLDGQLAARARHHWVLEETQALAAHELYEINHEESWKRLKIRSAQPKDLNAVRLLCTWREHEAQRKNVPRARILKDETLLDLAYQRPKNAQELERIRGIGREMAHGKFGQNLISVILKADQIPASDAPQLEKRVALPSKLTGQLEMLKMLLKICASEEDVAPKLITSSAELEDYLLNPTQPQPFSHGWRYDIFGRFIEQLQSGQIALTLDHGRIKILTIDKPKL
ncbi:MAG: ribonuclease D [Alphaproteobacteria bacterium]|nr:ribonuclease D [Alphaproteobacteria bacterium]